MYLKYAKFNTLVFFCDHNRPKTWVLSISILSGTTQANTGWFRSFLPTPRVIYFILQTESPSWTWKCQDWTFGYVQHFYDCVRPNRFSLGHLWFSGGKLFFLDCEKLIADKQSTEDGLADHYRALQQQLEETQKLELKIHETSLKELKIGKGKINQEFHRYNEDLIAKRKLQARLEQLYKTFEADRIKYRTLIDDKHKNWVTMSFMNQHKTKGKTKFEWSKG